MQVYLSELGLTDRVIFCKNGKEVVKYFKRFFSEQRHGDDQAERNIRLRHVSLMMLDINMP